MAGGFSVTLSGVPQLTHAFDELEAATADLSAPFGTIVAAAQKALGARFAQEGPGWAPLSPLYAKWKAVHAGGKGILVFSGHLRDSLTGGSGWTATITPQRLEFGSSVAYGRYHQEGTGRMPARPPLGFRQSDYDDFGGYISAHLAKVAQEAGFEATP